jgi:hypothetical protein
VKCASGKADEIRGQTGLVLCGNGKPLLTVLSVLCLLAKGELSFDPLATSVFPKYQARLTTRPGLTTGPGHMPQDINCCGCVGSLLSLGQQGRIQVG